MTSTLKRPGLGVVAYFALMFSLGIYFMFASVQGDFG
ncbi:MAG: septum formation initiator family protein, partial [Silicimonas sp.]|nr:septum formation initiator family protein [Silicimonas sp.]